jgi:hypothetical protein
MMSHLARITWLTPEEGGRRVAPSGPRYIAPVRFEGQTVAEWEREAWSLVVDLVSHPPESADWIAQVRYLVDEAPQELLRLGARFGLYEGKKCVARGAIINPKPEAVDLSGVRTAAEQIDAKR